MPDTQTSNRTRTRKPVTGTPYTILLGKVADIPIRLHYLLLLFLAWIAYSSSGPDRLNGVLLLIGIFTCVALHELGHSIVAQRYGIGVSEIVLYPIGGVARLEKLPEPRAELWIAIAGPAVNVVIATVLFAALRTTGSFVPWAQIGMTPGHF